MTVSGELTGIGRDAPLLLQDDYLRARLELFGRVGASLAGLALGLDVLVGLAVQGRQIANPVGDYTFPIVMIGVSFLSAWAVSRTRASQQTLRVTDVVATWGACMCQAWSIHVDPDAAGADAWGVAAAELVLMTRAVLVPSAGPRTLWIGAVGSGLLLLTIGVVLQDEVTRLATAGVFLTLGLALQTATSQVLFGLRRELRQARQLGRYTLLEKIGEGGMGEVYRAEHAMLRRPTAVKLLPAAAASPADIARFEREVQLASELRSPHAVSIFDYGRAADGTFYYAMEHLDGDDLQAVVERDGAMAERRVVAILDQVCDVLEEAHGLGLIHRDIKPANIVVGVRGASRDYVTVVDFGLAKDLRGVDAGLTDVNAVVGTPLYLAPEAIEDPGRVGPAGDIYSLGCVGFWLCTAEPVFTGATVYEVCAKHLGEAPPSPRERGAEISLELNALLLACLAKDPAARPASARVLREGLRALGESKLSLVPPRAG